MAVHEAGLPFGLLRQELAEVVLKVPVEPLNILVGAGGRRAGVAEEEGWGCRGGRSEDRLSGLGDDGRGNVDPRRGQLESEVGRPRAARDGVVCRCNA